MERATIDWLVRGGMFTLMFGMGLALSRADFARVLSYPRATLVGSGVQLLAMPLSGLAIALAFGLPPLFAAGLVICAACPGGTMSNVVVHLGKADTALSITLTATATLVSLLTLPFWVRGLLALIGGESARIEVPVVATALSLGSMTILPVVLGMALRPRLEDPARFERWATRVGAAIVVVALTYQGLSEDSETFAGASSTVVPVLCLIATGTLLGYALPLMLRIPLAQSATIGIEVVLKNTVLGIFMATQSLGLKAAVPLALYMSLHLPVSVAIVASYRILARRQGILPAEPEVQSRA